VSLPISSPFKHYTGPLKERKVSFLRACLNKRHTGPLKERKASLLRVWLHKRHTTALKGGLFAGSPFRVVVSSKNLHLFYEPRLPYAER